MNRFLQCTLFFVTAVALSLCVAEVASAAPGPPSAPVGSSLGTIAPAIAALAGVGVWWAIRKK